MLDVFIMYTCMYIGMYICNLHVYMNVYVYAV